MKRLLLAATLAAGLTTPDVQAAGQVRMPIICQARTLRMKDMATETDLQFSRENPSANRDAFEIKKHALMKEIIALSTASPSDLTLLEQGVYRTILKSCLQALGQMHPRDRELQTLNMLFEKLTDPSIPLENRTRYPRLEAAFETVVTQEQNAIRSKQIQTNTAPDEHSPLHQEWQELIRLGLTPTYVVSAENPLANAPTFIYFGQIHNVQDPQFAPLGLSSSAVDSRFWPGIDASQTHIAESISKLANADVLLEMLKEGLPFPFQINQKRFEEPNGSEELEDGIARARRSLKEAFPVLGIEDILFFEVLTRRDATGDTEAIRHRVQINNLALAFNLLERAKAHHVEDDDTQFIGFSLGIGHELNTDNDKIDPLEMSLLMASLGMNVIVIDTFPLYKESVQRVVQEYLVDARVKHNELSQSSHLDSHPPELHAKVLEAYGRTGLNNYMSDFDRLITSGEMLAQGDFINTEISEHEWLKLRDYLMGSDLTHQLRYIENEHIRDLLERSNGDALKILELAPEYADQVETDKDLKNFLNNLIFYRVISLNTNMIFTGQAHEPSPYEQDLIEATSQLQFLN
jgi:hypothetical protein